MLWLLYYHWHGSVLQIYFQMTTLIFWNFLCTSFLLQFLNLLNLESRAGLLENLTCFTIFNNVWIYLFFFLFPFSDFLKRILRAGSDLCPVVLFTLWIASYWSSSFLVNNVEIFHGPLSFGILKTLVPLGFMQHRFNILKIHLLQSW